MPGLLIRPRARGLGQAGMGMIEVMVSCLVLSAGLAVIAAMQTRAIVASSNTAIQATMAQALWSYNEARLVNLNDFRSGGATQCNGLSTQSTRQADLDFFNRYFNTSTPCGVAVLTEFQADTTSTQCFKPIAQTRIATCTLRNDGSSTVFTTPVWTP